MTRVPPLTLAICKEYIGGASARDIALRYQKTSNYVSFVLASHLQRVIEQLEEQSTEDEFETEREDGYSA